MVEGAMVRGRGDDEVPSGPLHQANFDWHFASAQVSSDIFGTCLGMSVYLSLMPSLLSLGRPDLAAAAVACAAMSPWPLLLCRLGPRARAFYLANRDHLFVVHAMFHYAVGGQFAHVVRLDAKLGATSTPSFVAGFVASSTALWQALDALMYRQRWHRFVLAKPLVLLTVLPLEWRLCQTTACVTAPDQAHHFSAAANFARLVMAPFRPWSRGPADAAAAADSAGVSCFKLQSFLLLVTSWLLPAVVLRRLERRMLAKFALAPDTAAQGPPAGVAPAAAALAADGAVALGKAEGHCPLCGRAAPATADQRRPAGSPALLSAGVLLAAAVLLPSLALVASDAGGFVSAAAAAVASCLVAASVVPPTLGPASPEPRQRRSSGARLERCWRGWLEQQAPAGGCCAPEECGMLELMGWPAWAAPLLLAALCWHAIDAAL